MNKFTRVILITVCILAGVGIVSMLVAFAMGLNKMDIIGNLDERIDTFEQALEDGSIDMKYGIEFDVSGKDGFHVDFVMEDDSEDLTSKDSYPDVNAINIEAGASVIYISYGDVEAVELYYDKLGKVDTKVDESVLEIECGSKKGEKLEIILPQNLQLQELNLEIGAGQVDVENIDFIRLDAEVGAGELTISVPDVVGAYDYEVNCGLGQIEIGDEIYAGIVNTEKHNGAQKQMDIDCGAGKVEISFME